MSKTITTLAVMMEIKNFPMYFLDYFEARTKNFTHKFRDGTKIMVRPSLFYGHTDRRAIDETFIHEDYNPWGFELKKSDVVVDVGGFIGDYSLYASKRARKIFTFEPLPENLEMLKINLNLNKSKNIKLYEMAMSGKTGKIQFYQEDKKHLGSSSTFKELCAEPTEIEVKSISFNDFIRQENLQRIDFLKMDCEGAEYEIFRKLSKENLKKIKKIAMEYHDMDKEKNCFALANFLTREGFEVKLKQGTHGYGMIYAKRKC